MRFVFLCLFLIVSSAGCGLRGKRGEPSSEIPRLVDLSYAFDESTIYWPTSKSFQHEKTAFGRTPGGYWYSSYNYSANEHGGTHMDAPIHFAEGREAVDQISVQREIGPGAKINIAEQASRDRDYRLSADDVRAWESRNGRIPRGTIVLIQTGWGRYWHDRAKYLGSQKAGDASDLHFPGIAQDAAELLAKDRNVLMVGIDTASLDYGASKDFIVHQIFSGGGIPGLENVAALDQVAETGFMVLALPMKIAGGSGAPCRIVALLDEHANKRNR